MIGHHISCIANQFAREIADLNYDKDVGDLNEKKWSDLCRLTHNKDILDKWIQRINVSQLILITIGIILLGFFVFATIGSSKIAPSPARNYCQKETWMSSAGKEQPYHGISERKGSLLDEQAITTQQDAISLLTKPSPLSKPPTDVPCDCDSGVKPDTKLATKDKHQDK